MTLPLVIKTKIKVKILNILRAFIIIGLTFIILLPVYKMFVDSISNSEPGEYYFFIPTRITFINYRRIFRRYFQNNLLLNTLIFSTLCGFIQTLVCGITGFAFSKLKFKGYKIIMVLYFIPLLLIKEGMYVQYKALLNEMPLFGINFFHNKYSVYVLYRHAAV